MGGVYVPLESVGALRTDPAARLGAPTIVVDAGSPREYLSTGERPPATGLVLASGPGAEAAVADAVRHLGVGKVLTRTSWLGNAPGGPLVDGMLELMLVSAAAVALLAGLVLLLVVTATAGARRQSLSYVRTLGLDSRAAAVLGALELAPLVVLAALAGLPVGAAVPTLLDPALDLRSLSIGFTDRPPVGWGLVVTASLAGLLLAAVAVAADAAHARRARLGRVLRLGGEA